ncbi:hypothetical protein QBC38DRAFT_518193 [Podospora fimiseda]|uniref:Uncharacterized protein n=1 Tax=Podospora fimiseda TaxID=252190 RepID=A0AAN6YQ24_9PEZI|nr:hypothetical protein QBC38DRAFT_518193 [Podospora fimiseda]
MSEKLARVDRLNCELLRDLQMVALELQSTSSKLSGRMLSSLDATHGALRAMHATGHTVSSAVNDIRLNQRLQTSELGLLQKEIRIMRAELQAMGSNLVKAITTNAQSSSRNMLHGLELLAPNEMATLERAVRRHFVQKPSALRDAHEISRRALRKVSQCNCDPTLDRNEKSLGPWWFVHSQESQHLRTCHFYNVGDQSWQSKLTAQLFPFFNQTIELTIGATWRSGVVNVSTFEIERLSAEEGFTNFWYT